MVVFLHRFTARPCRRCAHLSVDSRGAVALGFPVPTRPRRPARRRLWPESAPSMIGHPVMVDVPSKRDRLRQATAHRRLLAPKPEEHVRRPHHPDMIDAILPLLVTRPVSPTWPPAKKAILLKRPSEHVRLLFIAGLRVEPVDIRRCRTKGTDCDFGVLLLRPRSPREEAGPLKGP
jgi:hypothetical protein